MNKAEIAVMGIGNILMQDEGIGVHIIRELEKYDFNPHIALIDGGIHYPPNLFLKSILKLVRSGIQLKICH